MRCKRCKSRRVLTVVEITVWTVGKSSILGSPKFCKQCAIIAYNQIKLIAEGGDPRA